MFQGRAATPCEKGNIRTVPPWQGIETVEGLFDAHLARGGMAALTTHHRIDLARAKVHRINLSA